MKENLIGQHHKITGLGRNHCHCFHWRTGKVNLPREACRLLRVVPLLPQALLGGQELRLVEQEVEGLLGEVVEHKVKKQLDAALGASPLLVPLLTLDVLKRVLLPLTLVVQLQVVLAELLSHAFSLNCLAGVVYM